MFELGQEETEIAAEEDQSDLIRRLTEFKYCLFDIREHNPNGKNEDRSGRTGQVSWHLGSSLQGLGH